MDLRKQELVWLARQRWPVWGGHLVRGEPLRDAQMRAWIDDGIIEAVEQPCKGYVLTEKGRALTSH